MPAIPREWPFGQIPTNNTLNTVNVLNDMQSESSVSFDGDHGINDYTVPDPLAISTIMGDSFEESERMMIIQDENMEQVYSD